MTEEQPSARAAAASVGELCWVDTAGLPRVRGVVPLARDGRPVVALTYADAALAREIAVASVVVLALTEPRSTGRGFRPSLLTARPRLVEDPTGELFVGDLLAQELRKYPPSRLYADSPLLMREHWWYLPRLVVELDLVSAEPVASRTGERDHLLVVAPGTPQQPELPPEVRVVGVGSSSPDLLDLDLAGLAPPPGPAVVFGQDASFPDLECWAQWHHRGRWTGTVLEVEQPAADVGLGRPPGLVQRWWRQRTLERRCVEAIPRRP